MLMEVDKNLYTNGELTVVYDPKKCANAGLCCAGLSEVFRSSVIPWIDLDGAPNEEIIKQISKCPSGALKLVQNKVLVH